MGGRTGVATIGCDEAVGLRGVAFGEMALRDAVVTEHEVIVGLRQIRAGAGDEGVDVVGFGVERLGAGDLHGGRELGGDPADFDHDGFPARHRVVRVLREEQDFVDARRDEAADRVGDRRIAIVHGEVDRSAQAFLEGGLGELARDDQRGASVGPNGGVGVGGVFGAKRDDNAVDQHTPEEGRARSVDDALIAEEFAQVAFDVWDGSGIGRTEVEEEDSALSHTGRDLSAGNRRCQMAAARRRRSLMASARPARPGASSICRRVKPAWSSSRRRAKSRWATRGRSPR